MDERAVAESLMLDAHWVGELRRGWLALIEVAVWGDVRGLRPGGSARVRRRAVETGERLRSLTASRDWIPRPREQLKNALASALDAEEALAALAQETGNLQGADVARFEHALSELNAVLAQHLPALKTRWADLLESR